MNKRVFYLDNLSGLLIIEMIFLCHIRILSVMIPDSGFLYQLQYFLIFFMPWFFFKSGMFYGRNLKHDITKDAKKLLVPFVYYYRLPFVEPAGRNCKWRRNPMESANVVSCYFVYC